MSTMAPSITLPTSDTWPRDRRWTREEFHMLVDRGVLPEEGGIELIGGRIVNMAPVSEPHAVAVNIVQRVLYRTFGEGITVRPQLPLRLPDDSEPEPDLAVVLGHPRDYLTSHPTTALLVVEISHATLAYDRSVKAGLYAMAGIADYWILNLRDRTVEVHRDPAAEPGNPFGHGYRTRFVVTSDQTLAPAARADHSIAVADLLP